MPTDPALPTWDGRTFGRLLSELGRRAHRDYLVAIATVGLRDLDFPVLSYVDRRPDCTQQHIVRDLRLNSGNLAGVVDRLDRAGLLARAPDPSDARRQLLQLTPAGQRTYRQAQEAVAAAEARMAAAFPPDRARRLLADLDAFLDATDPRRPDPSPR